MIAIDENIRYLGEKKLSEGEIRLLAKIFKVMAEELDDGEASTSIIDYLKEIRNNFAYNFDLLIEALDKK